MRQCFSVWNALGATRTVILHQRLHVLLDAFVPLCDVDVQRVVAAGLAVGPLAPLLEGRDEAHAGLRNHVVDWEHTNRGHAGSDPVVTSSLCHPWRLRPEPTVGHSRRTNALQVWSHVTVLSIFEDYQTVVRCICSRSLPHRAKLLFF